ncbi:helix-turn-helix domain-containing protein [Methylocella sp.]|uniref:helix-turn-helix domain-containing protein n=1 Tax=Methylocella sp. TaxID=1978226 RepID=UPI0037842EF8
MEALLGLFGDEVESLKDWLPLLVSIWEGRSFSDLTRVTQWIRRRATISGNTVLDVLLDKIGHDLRNGSAESRKRAARLLAEEGYSDRRISDIVGISRDTIRKSRADAISTSSGRV